MKLAVIGSGGREHALAWKLAQCMDPADVLVMPGNGGTANNVAVDPMDFPALEAACRQHGVSLLVVGPEAPLADGIADFFEGTGIRVFGPGQAGARLEGSKAWSKEFMARHGVATAEFENFAGPAAAHAWIERLGGPCVVKYSGLAAGKGVFVCDDLAQARQALETVEQRYGADAPTVVEARLVGNEISILGFTDGRSIELLMPSQDHKQLLEGDRGPNTGGMGAFCPVPAFSPAMLDVVQQRIVQPTLEGLRNEGIEYHGVIYFGIMMTRAGPQLLEYNVRLGDPETEVVLPAMDSSLLGLIDACLDGTLADYAMRFRPGFFVDLVLASGGYPGSYPKGLPITGLDALPSGVQVFHAGTRVTDGQLVTAGGRVLNVVAHGRDLDSAIRLAYSAAEGIHFDGKITRGDIGRRAWIR